MLTKDKLKVETTFPNLNIFVPYLKYSKQKGARTLSKGEEPLAFKCKSLSIDLETEASSLAHG